MHAPLLLGFLALARKAQSVTIELDESLSYQALDTERAVKFPSELVRESCPEFFPPPPPPPPPGSGRVGDDTTVRLSTFGLVGQQGFDNGTMYPSSSSFVRGAVEAWAQHQHLFIRPEEVWFTILSQLAIYLRRNPTAAAPLLRTQQLDQHIEAPTVSDGTKEVDIIEHFDAVVKARVRKRSLMKWIKPGFRDSSEDDDLTAQIIMMGSAQKFLSFEPDFLCGLPAVTLEGDKSDWEKLRRKTRRLAEFGREPAEFAQVLKPIMNGFVRTFADPKSGKVSKFWSLFIKGSRDAACMPSSAHKLDGWITGFCFWNSDGSLRVPPGREEVSRGGVRLGNVTYVPHRVRDLPASYSKVSMGDSILVAGNIGVFRATISGHESKKPRVIAEPVSGWYWINPIGAGRELSRDQQNDRELDYIERSLSDHNH